MVPLVISCGPRALPTAALASRHYALRGVKSIVVRPAGCASRDGEFEPGSTFIDDEALAGVTEVGAFLVAHGATLATLARSPGWYLQQFIKLAALASIDEELVFLTDGDTIFSLAIVEAVLSQPIVLTTGERFESYNRLVRALGQSPLARSCVANGNIFPRHPLLRRLATPEGFLEVLQRHVIPSRGALDFSEYQIAGSLLEPRLGSRAIKMFRRFDLLLDDRDRVPRDLVAQALARYDAVAIEANHHRSRMKSVAAAVLYRFGGSW